MGLGEQVEVGASSFCGKVVVMLPADATVVGEGVAVSLLAWFSARSWPVSCIDPAQGRL